MQRTLIDFHSDILRIVISFLSSSKTLPIVLRFVCRRFRDLVPFSPSIKMHARFFCTNAAFEGNLDLLKWARSMGAPWDSAICTQAAEGGHLEVLQWLREKGCPWNVRVCNAAARYGHLELLKWARSKGCPWSAETCSVAAKEGQLGVLKWLRANGCPWDDSTCTNAVLSGHLEVLKWAIANGCPYKKEYLMNHENVRLWVEDGALVFDEKCRIM